VQVLAIHKILSFCLWKQRFGHLNNHRCLAIRAGARRQPHPTPIGTTQWIHLWIWAYFRKYIFIDLISDNMVCVHLQTSTLKFKVINLMYCLFQQQYIVLVLFVSIVIKYVANCGLFKCNSILVLFVYTNNCHVLHLISSNLWLSVSVEPTYCGTQRSRIQSQVRQGFLSLPFVLLLCFIYQNFIFH